MGVELYSKLGMPQDPTYSQTNLSPTALPHRQHNLPVWLAHDETSWPPPWLVFSMPFTPLLCHCPGCMPAIGHSEAPSQSPPRLVPDRRYCFAQGPEGAAPPK